MFLNSLGTNSDKIYIVANLILIMIFPNEKYIALETFRKNGDAVMTPVWFVEHDDLIWVVTREFTGKVSIPLKSWGI